MRLFGHRRVRSSLVQTSDNNVGGFALAVEPVELVEVRRELLREAKHWLGEWERHRDEEARGRLLQSLEMLAMFFPPPR